MSEAVESNELFLNGSAYCLGHGAAPETSSNRTALIVVADRQGTESERWSFRDLEAQVLRIAGGLRERGLERGDRVLLRLENTSDFPLFFFAILAAGGIAVPTSVMLTAPECDYLVQSAEPKFILHDGKTRLPRTLEFSDNGRLGGVSRLLGPKECTALKSSTPAVYVQTAPDDPAYLVYTSGTSGTPKGVLHAHRAISGRAPMYQGWYGIGPKDRLLHAGAFNWTYTLGAGLMDPWANGATSIIYCGERDPQIWPDLISRSEATLFAAVPGLFRRILKYSDLSPKHLGTLRHGLAAGESLRVNLHDEWVERTGLPLYEAFGMSEISTFVSSSAGVPTRPGSPGKAQSGRRIAILSDACPEADLKTGQINAARSDQESLPSGESGLLCVHRSDPGLMLGYWQEEDATAASFRGEWFVTGDRARLDADGYVWHEGRADDVMNTFGYRVAPDEVERVLLDHPAISEVAVTDIEVSQDVRLITGFVVLNPNHVLDQGALDTWCGDRLAAYKVPKQFVVLDTLPRTASGKVMRRSLKMPLARSK